MSELTNQNDLTLTQGKLTVQDGIAGNSILQPSGYYGPRWPAESGLVIPEGLSTGGWTMEARGIMQQTFLGGSIRSFNMNGGFGDTSSNLTVELINDEFNKSDLTAYGLGVDEYHGGQKDFVLPPIPGTPVYFKFGENLATVTQAYRKTFDNLYGYNTIPAGSTSKAEFERYFQAAFATSPSATFYRYGARKTPIAYAPGLFKSFITGGTYNLQSFRIKNSDDQARGENHIVFGGILQSFIQNRSSAGNPLYSVQVTDPREILSNVTVILNNYVGSTYNEKNIINAYGFLEYNIPKSVLSQVLSYAGEKNILTKKVDLQTGIISYEGTIPHAPPMWPYIPIDCYIKQEYSGFGKTTVPKHFPITGTGFSRRSSQGIPWYRVKQALAALMELNTELPPIYKDAGFSGIINFRGYNYIVDFGGLPDLPDLYFLDFDQINLLDLCLEICDVTSRDLFVSLLPVINHPACENIYKNNTKKHRNNKDKFIAGIIRLDSIDRSKPPQYGAIKKYIDNLATQGILVENQDVGYELSNVVTNKFVVGAQEVEHYFFSGNHDRDLIQAARKTSPSYSINQWLLDKQLEQQIIPYYGLLGNNAVTIPKGWGAYQQILLDATGLDANGVGSYYVATEMELRYASISYKAWSDFLMSYNDNYMEDINPNLAFGTALTATPTFGPGFARVPGTYGVSVPRSVFDTYALTPFGPDDLPTSACNPPYGYPLYYKRATKIGIPAGGLTKLSSRLTAMIVAAAKGAGASKYTDIRNSVLAEIDSLLYDGTMSAQERSYYDSIRAELAKPKPNIAVLNNVAEGLHRTQGILPKLAKKGIENSMKVYEFVKKIADENLGKKFLVKIPQRVNTKYSNQIILEALPGGFAKYTNGPFGFKPISLSNDFSSQFTRQFWLQTVGQYSPGWDNSFIKSFLSPTGYSPEPTGCVGALRGSFNPIADKYEFNYTPTNLGGFFAFDLYSNVFSSNDIGLMNLVNRPSGVSLKLIPQDLTNFITPEGRVSPYVRFDNSQDLAMHLINSEDYTQQIIPNDMFGNMIPDAVQGLDNTGDDNIDFATYNASRVDKEPKTKACAFVKCSVDEKFYMTPKLAARSITVYGNADPTSKVSKPGKIFISCSGWLNDVPGTVLVPGTGCFVDSYKPVTLLYIPNKETTTSSQRFDYLRYLEPALNSYIINTYLPNLDTNNVYALITLPGKVVPTKPARFREATLGKQHWDVHHYLTMDVVRGLPEFNTPGYARFGNPQGGGFNFSAETRSKALLAKNQAIKSLKFAGPMAMQYIAPSPVYPDMVALPLISNDRCYGPWISSYLDGQASSFKDIGGRVEFVKDENLAPWNYAGYDLMNEAGSLQASFANNLLLFSERGGFSVPGIPGISLCQALIEGGPLVTNIAVDVSTGGIKTTYKMDLYTASFGKLQKQKQEMISKISRERQKLTEQRNSLIRKGIVKSQSTLGIGNINQAASVGGNIFSSVNGAPTHIVASLTQANVPSKSSFGSFGADGLFGSDSATNLESDDFINDAGFQSADEISERMNEYENVYDRTAAESEAGVSKISDMYTPYSEDTYHPSLPNVQYADSKMLKSFFDEDDSTTSPID